MKTNNCCSIISSAPACPLLSVPVISRLQKRQDIVIKHVDKGGAVVVWKKDIYVEEGMSQFGKSYYYTPCNLDQHTNLSIPTHVLLTLAELFPTLNSFEFNRQHFEQISGGDMGTKMGLSYACLFLEHFEYLIHQQYDG